MNFFTNSWEVINTFAKTQRLPLRDWANIFSWDFWTAGPLAGNSAYLLFSLAVVALLLAALIIWRRQLKRLQHQIPIYDGPINQIANVIAFVVIMAASYSFFRLQQITYLSSRLVVLASLTVLIVWLGAIIYELKRNIPERRRLYLEKERFFRYLPKKRK